jgi:hypothetical protein
VDVAIGLHEVDMADAKSIGEMEEGHDSRVAQSPLKVADILLGEA